ncbi:hypothetical protein D3C83_252850 [compost metagenome]
MDIRVLEVMIQIVDVEAREFASRNRELEVGAVLFGVDATPNLGWIEGQHERKWVELVFDAEIVLTRSARTLTAG